MLGASYTASLHYATAPFSKDIKGAVFEVQDSERYRLWYRNGQLRRGHANWYFGLYKQRLKKSFSSESFSELPLAGLSERAFCEVAEDFEKTLTASDPRSSFWSTRLGGSDTRGATNNAGIPLLLTTGYNDFYVGGVFKMWREMSEKTKRISAMLVSPYDHSDGFDKDAGIEFPLGKRREAFGKDYQIDWFDSIRLGTPLPYKRGVITYYRAFEDRWDSDFYKGKTKGISLPLGEGEAVFDYDPKTPATFSAEGRYQREFFEGDGVIKLYTPPAQQDIFVKGAMRLSLAASSSAQDTSFYAAISIQKPSGDYTLRHDVTSIRYQRGDYSSGETVELSFSFDEYAFLLKRGERLRIDIAATDAGVYVCHTNQAGEYYKIRESIKATNRVDLSLSRLILPIEV